MNSINTLKDNLRHSLEELREAGNFTFAQMIQIAEQELIEIVVQTSTGYLYSVYDPAFGTGYFFRQEGINYLVPVCSSKLTDNLLKKLEDLSTSPLSGVNNLVEITGWSNRENELVIVTVKPFYKVN